MPKRMPRHSMPASLRCGLTRLAVEPLVELPGGATQAIDCMEDAGMVSRYVYDVDSLGHGISWSTTCLVSDVKVA